MGLNQVSDRFVIMVFILDGSSEHVANVKPEAGFSIC